MKNKYHIKGRIKKICFNSDTNYAYATLSVLEQEPRYNGAKFAEIKIRSQIGQKAYEGDVVDFTGVMTCNEYGRVIKSVESFRVVLPQEERDICKYFSARALRIKGRDVKHCIATYGMDFMYAILRNPELLANDRMLSPATRKKITQACIAEHDFPMVIAYLKSAGVNTKHAVRLKQEYPDTSLDTLRTNPYVLRNITFGECSFMDCDKIAYKFNISPIASVRLKAIVREGMAYVVEQERSTYTFREELIEHCMRIQVGTLYADHNEFANKDMVNMQIDAFLKSGDFVQTEDGCLYRKGMLNLETHINDFINYKIGQAGLLPIEKSVQIVNAMHTDCDDTQKGAVINALSNSISILTGGPGTGKTKTINTIIEAIKSVIPTAKIRLLAPTGVAARRMEENTQLTAETIHKSCKIIKDVRMDDKFRLAADVVIIDEFSMVDIFVFGHLISCIDDTTKIIIVGDHDQLPSVSCGALMKDFVSSGIIPCTVLDHVYRQADGTIISHIAQAFRQQKTIDNKDLCRNGFYFLQRDAWHTQATLKASIDKLLKGGRTFDDILILSPRRIGVHGTEDINRFIQSAYNLEKDYVEHGETRYKKNDIVMCIQNDYENDVMNGERGKVKRASQSDGKVVVDFGNGRIVEYERGSLDSIELAYATTIHKAQGTECKNVICLCTSEFSHIYNNLIYTAVTRAKEQCIIIGSLDKFFASEYQPMPTRRSNILKVKVRNA